MSKTKNLIKFTVIVIVALVALGFNNKVKADRLTTTFDQMSRVASNVNASHTIYFSITSAVSSGESFTITFPSAFTFGSSYDFNDVVLEQGNIASCLTATFTGKTVGTTPSGATWGVSKSGTTTITFTSGTDTLTANRCVRVTLNTNGTNHTISNPNVSTNTVYNVEIATASDAGQLALIILGDASATNVDQVSLNAKISTSILMGIDTVTTDCNNSTQTTPANQSVNFGQLYPGTAQISGAVIPYVCIEAGTNSVNGFRILVQSSRANTVGGLVASGGTIVSATANLNVAGSGYGLRVSSTGTPTLGTFSATSPFNSGTSGDIGLVSGTLGTASQIITSTAPVRSGSSSRIAIELAAKSDTSTVSGSYTDTLTFTAFTNL